MIANAASGVTPLGAVIREIPDQFSRAGKRNEVCSPEGGGFVCRSPS